MTKSNAENSNSTAEKMTSQRSTLPYRNQHRRKRKLNLSSTLKDFLSKPPEPKVPSDFFDEKLPEVKFTEIIPGKLLISTSEQSNSPEFINHHKITAILSFENDLEDEGKDVLNASQHNEFLTIKTIKINDKCKTDIKTHFDDIIEFINANRTVLVTSARAKSRSATAIIAYLMVFHEMDLNSAREFLAAKRSTIMPNFSYLGQLKFYEDEIGLQFRHGENDSGIG